ncbi:MAG: ABC transporter permease [Cytophagaceae bacterium]|nr:ABC transporter permease [Gemmatimonadaceae bacterium]
MVSSPATARSFARQEGGAGLRDSVWGARELLVALVARNLRMRYQRSALGFLWVLLNPVLTTLIMVGVFRYVLHIPVDQYWGFLISGYFAWIFIVHSVTESAGTIREHSYMARTLAFPADVLVISTLMSRILEFVLEIILVASLLAVFRHGGVPAAFALLPLAVALLVGMALALAYPIAAASVFFKDVEFALPVGFTLLGYLSPVFYPLALVPEAWRDLYSLNPMVGLLGIFHAILYDGRVPPFSLFAISAVEVTILLVIGRQLFRWKRSLFAEIV